MPHQSFACNFTGIRGNNDYQKVGSITLSMKSSNSENSKNSLGLSIRNLAFKYANTAVLNQLNLEVEKNSLVLLDGPSGCGKTSLLRLISGLEQPCEGTISFGGETWSKPGQAMPPWDRNVDMLFQFDALWPNLTVIEQIAWVQKHRQTSGEDNEIKELIDALGLSNLLDRMPAGLSGGQARRCQLARVLAGKPSLLLLDEPLAAQDSTTAGLTAAALKSWVKSYPCTLILVTHQTKYFGEDFWKVVTLEEINSPG